MATTRTEREVLRKREKVLKFIAPMVRNTGSADEREEKKEIKRRQRFFALVF